MSITSKIPKIPTEHIEPKYSPESKLQVESTYSDGILSILEIILPLASFKKSRIKEGAALTELTQNPNPNSGFRVNPHKISKRERLWAEFGLSKFLMIL